MKNLHCHNSTIGHRFAANACTCYGSTAAVACAKFCSHHYNRTLMRAKKYICVKLEMMEKPLVEWAPDPALVVCVGSLILASAHSCYLNCYTASVWWYSINKWLPLGLCKETVKELLLPEPSGRWGKGSSGDLGPSHKKICCLCKEFLFLYSVHFDFMLKSCLYRDSSSVVVIWACSVKIKAKYI